MNKYGRKRTLKVIVFGTFHFDNLSGFEIFNFVEVLPLFWQSFLVKCIKNAYFFAKRVKIMQNRRFVNE